jgi:hypothetical protein
MLGPLSRSSGISLAGSPHNGHASSSSSASRSASKYKAQPVHSHNIERRHRQLPFGGRADLPKRPAEVSQNPHREKIDGEQRLDAGDGSDPSGSAQGVLAGPHAG